MVRSREENMSTTSNAEDPWDKYRAMLDAFIASYTNPTRFQELRDVEVYHELMRQTPEDIATVLLVAINRLSESKT
jgi:hypothetical protein